MRHYLPPQIASLAADWTRVARVPTGTVSVQLRDVGGPIAGRLEHMTHYAASTVKLAIGVTALADIETRRTDQHHPVAVHDTFPGAGSREFRLSRADDNDDATWNRLGASDTFGNLLERMIVDSSNIAANLVAQRVTLRAVGRTLGLAPGPAVTMSHLFGDRLAQASASRNAVTAAGLGALMAAVARGHLISPAATHGLLELLARQTTRQMIPAGLPAGTWSAGKPGWFGDVNHDVQLVRPDGAPEYILAVCTTTGLGGDAAGLIASISRITWKHWTAWHTS